jgi:hypothetical protein
MAEVGFEQSSVSVVCVSVVCEILSSSPFALLGTFRLVLSFRALHDDTDFSGHISWSAVPFLGWNQVSTIIKDTWSKAV